MEQLIENLKKQIVETLKLADIDPASIQTDAPLIGAGLGLDSIDTLELLVLLEKEYGITIPDVNVGRSVFASVRSLAEFITSQKKI